MLGRKRRVARLIYFIFLNDDDEREECSPHYHYHQSSYSPPSLSLSPVGSSYIQMVPRLLLLLPARLRPFLKLAIQMKKSCCLSWFPQSRLLLLLLPFALFLFLSALDFCSCPENNPLMTLLGRNSPSYVFFPICLCVQWRGGRVSCAWGANSFPGQSSSEVNILIV